MVHNHKNLKSSHDKDSKMTLSKVKTLPLRMNGGVFLDVLLLILILLMVFFVWRYGWSWIDSNPDINSAQDVNAARGQFGDKFGAINALFAGCAFAGIIFTIFLQSREIRQTKSMLEEQLKGANKNRFDGTFFELIKLHSDITSKLSDLQHNGRHAFRAFHERIILSDTDFPAFCALNKFSREEIRIIRDLRSIPDSMKSRLQAADISNLETALERGTACCDNYLDDTLAHHEEKIRRAYALAAEQHIDNYSHYFRNLYHALRFIKESDLIDEGEKQRYAKILRSQLSEPELVGLFYNSLTLISLPGREGMELGHPKMGRLLKEFDVLQNLSPRTVLHPKHLDIFDLNNGGKQHV